MSPARSSVRGDATALVERMASMARAGGARHPTAAALSRAARGDAGLGVLEWANRLGLDVDAVRAAEAGDVSWPELPRPLDRRIAELAETAHLDLLALADLDDERHAGPGWHPASGGRGGQ